MTSQAESKIHRKNAELRRLRDSISKTQSSIDRIQTEIIDLLIQQMKKTTPR